MNGKVIPLTARIPRIGQAYKAPGGDSPRKAVVCPTDEAPQVETTASP
jgi:soluble lytic murein transglycosylase